MCTSVLVFLQNGYIDTYLEKNKLLENTQALLFFAVTAKGADPIDGVTTVNPEGLTSVTGKHAEDFKKRLDKLDLKCNVLSKGSYEKAMWEKLIWICAYMLVGTAKDCASVGEAQEKHGDVVKSLVGELAESVDGVTFDGGVMDRLAAYTDVVSDSSAGAAILRSPTKAPSAALARKASRELSRARRRVTLDEVTCRSAKS